MSSSGLQRRLKTHERALTSKDSLENAAPKRHFPRNFYGIGRACLCRAHRPLGPGSSGLADGLRVNGSLHSGGPAHKGEARLWPPRLRGNCPCSPSNKTRFGTWRSGVGGPFSARLLCQMADLPFFHAFAGGARFTGSRLQRPRQASKTASLRP